MKPYTLTNREGESISPMTSTKTVFDEKGVDLDTLLLQQRQDGENALKDYAKKTEVTQDLSGKQDKLSTTTDLHITDDNILGLTELAKMRLFIDQWNTACGSFGRYNPETGYFELNGLTDITYEEALQIYCYYSPTAYQKNLYNSAKVRTNIPNANFDGYDMDLAFIFCNTIEVVRLCNDNSRVRGKFNSTYRRAGKLRRILGVMDSPVFDNLTFEYCGALEDVKILCTFNRSIPSINLKWSPKISLDSFNYYVTNKGQASATIITVHPDVYAKLTGDTTNAAAAVLTEEELAQWQQLLVDAAEKQITFATT